MLCVLNSLGTPHTKSFGVPKLSGKVQFNGSNYLSTTQNLAIGSGQFTIEFWLKPQRANTNQQGYVGSGNGSSGWAIYMSYAQDNKISFKIEGGTNHLSSSIPTAGSWMHIAVQRNGANRIQIYIDGVLNYTSATTDTSNLTTTLGYVIGRAYSTVAGVNAQNGTQIAGLRMSNIARYSANFTPSQNQIPHGTNTYAVFNFKSSSTFLQTENNAYSLTNNSAVSWVSGFP